MADLGDGIGAFSAPSGSSVLVADDIESPAVDMAPEPEPPLSDSRGFVTKGFRRSSGKSHTFTFGGRTRSRERRSSDVGMAEAQGLIYDLINDTNTPKAIQSKLQQVMELLSSPITMVGPSASPLPPAAADTMAAHDPTILRHMQSGDLSGKNTKVTPIRRFSASVWTTVTSATGMPAVEEQPHQKRVSAPSHPHRLSASSRRGTLPAMPRRQSADLGRSEITKVSGHPVLQRRSTGEGYVERSLLTNAIFSGKRNNLSSDDQPEISALPTIAITDRSHSEPAPAADDASKTSSKSVPMDVEKIGMPREYLTHVLAYDLKYDGKGLVPTSCTAEEFLEYDDPVEDDNPGVDLDAMLLETSEFGSPKDSPLLDELNCWDFPIFNLAVETQGQVLSVMIHRLFEEADLFSELNIPQKEFMTYFRAVEAGYHNANAYHNKIHAADVLHGIAYLLNQRIIGFSAGSGEASTSTSPRPSLELICTQVDDIRRDSYDSCLDEDALPEGSCGELRAALTPLELAACYIASAQHDYDHPARTNAFLVATQHHLALLYNDRSVLEHHHAASSWKLLLQDGYHFLSKLSPSEYKTIRFLILELILATDLAKHFEMIRTFNAKVETDSIALGDHEDRLMMMQMCIKVADINGPAKTGNLHRKWAYLIAEEFYDQGDQERSLGMPISPYMDRYDPKLPKLQVTFIGNLLRPLLQAYANGGFMPGPYEFITDETSDEQDAEVRSRPTSPAALSSRVCSLLLQHADTNEKFWKKVIAKQEAKQEAEKKLLTAGSSKAAQK